MHTALCADDSPICQMRRGPITMPRLKMRRKFLGRSTLLGIRRSAHAALDKDGIMTGGSAVIGFGTASRRGQDGRRGTGRSLVCCQPSIDRLEYRLQAERTG
jgi:hypothetical protein